MTASTSTPTRGSARACSSTAASAGAASVSISATSRTTSPSRRSAWAALSINTPHTDAVLRRAPAVPAERQGPAHVSVPVGHRRLDQLPEPAGCAGRRQLPADEYHPGPDARPHVLERRADGQHRRSRACCISIASIRPTCGSRRSIRYRATTIRPTVSVYNLFNANPTNTNAAFQTTYGDLVACADGHHDAALRGLRPAD